MTQHELDTIDERADREILELLCCAMTKCHINGRRPSRRLQRKYDAARIRFDNSLPAGVRYVIDCRIEQNRNGKPKRGGRISCKIVTMSLQEYKAAFIDDDEDEDDDDDDEF